jgi:hypothetical protein
VPWLRWLVIGLSPRRPGFVPGSVHVGCVVDKVALGQVFLRILRFSPVNFIPPVLHSNGKAEETSSSSSSSAQGCTISLQGCGASVASAAGPFNKKCTNNVAYPYLWSVSAELIICPFCCLNRTDCTKPLTWRVTFQPLNSESRRKFNLYLPSQGQCCTEKSIKNPYLQNVIWSYKIVWCSCNVYVPKHLNGQAKKIKPCCW